VRSTAGFCSWWGIDGSGKVQQIGGLGNDDSNNILKYLLFR